MDTLRQPRLDKLKVALAGSTGVMHQDVDDVHRKRSITVNQIRHSKILRGRR